MWVVFQNNLIDLSKYYRIYIDGYFLKFSGLDKSHDIIFQYEDGQFIQQALFYLKDLIGKENDIININFSNQSKNEQC